MMLLSEAIMLAAPVSVGTQHGWQCTAADAL